VTRSFARIALALGSTAFILVYVLVLFVAFATSGMALFGSPGAWYAAATPLVYAGVAGAYAYGAFRVTAPRAIIVAFHVAALPALAFSFLGLGLFLPVLTALWWVASRGKTGQAAAM